MSRRLRSFAKYRIASLQAVVVFASLVMAIAPPAWADDEADAIINKGVKALGGEARLAMAKATTSKVKRTFISGENASVSKIEHTTDGRDRMRTTVEGDFDGPKFMAVTVIDGDKGWLKEGEMEVMELKGQELADAKWGAFSQSAPLTLVPLKGKDLKFKTEAVGDEKVGGKPAAGVKVTGPNDKDFTIYFDKESGLPVKVVADLPDPESPGQEFTQETYFSDYKDFGGIKRATKIEIKCDDQTFIKIELLDFKVLNNVDDNTFRLANVTAAETITNSIGMKLVRIPAGEFMMGSEEDPSDTLSAFRYARRELLDREQPRHRVRITKPFYMGGYEVTLGQFLKFYHAANYKTERERDGKSSWGYDSKGTFIESKNFRPWSPGWKPTYEHPVLYVTWNDCVAFCRWLSKNEGKTYRLPTEAEWEYACRAGTNSRYHSGNDPEALVRYGNVADQDCKFRLGKDADEVTAVFQGKKIERKIPLPYVNGRDGYGFTAPVGQFRPNAFGLYDMHGNVWEWCSDVYDEGYYAHSPTDDPQGPSAGSSRVARGGGWLTSPLSDRCAWRTGVGYSSGNLNNGFRVVCELE